MLILYSRAETNAQQVAFQKGVQRLLERAEMLSTSFGISVQTEDNSVSCEVGDQKCMSGDNIKETSDDKPKPNQPESDDFATYGFYTPFYGPPNPNYHTNFPSHLPFYPGFRVPPPGPRPPNMFVNNEMYKPRRQMVYRAFPCPPRVSPRGPAPNLQRPSRPYAPRSGERMINRAELRPPAWIPDLFHQSQSVCVLFGFIL
ncbi:hypothetical protein AHF37_02852 [Paragonimus kellicotti]|nr:hypothetical protein AHF37_02852 [Paragonimus kellicotti]